MSSPTLSEMAGHRVVSDMYPIIVSGWGFEGSILIAENVTWDRMDEIAREFSGDAEDTSWRFADWSVHPAYCLPEETDTGVAVAVTNLDARSIVELWMR